MPAIVGTVNINNVGGVLNIGDVQIITPRSLTKTFAGAGSFNAAENIEVKNERSVMNVYENDQFDEAIIGNL